MRNKLKSVLIHKKSTRLHSFTKITEANMVISKVFYSILSAGICYGMSITILFEGLVGKGKILESIGFATFL
jgi:hypothetical protein